MQTVVAYLWVVLVCNLLIRVVPILALKVTGIVIFCVVSVVWTALMILALV